MRQFFTITLLCFTLIISAQHAPQFDKVYPDVHDPVMAQGEDGRYYIFSTGAGVGVMSSSDMKSWRQEKSVFAVTLKGRDGKEFKVEGNAPMPAWTTDSVPGFGGHFWAPDISYRNGKWHLYYSCSTFGKNGSAIGVAINKTLDPKSPNFKWVDQGPVVVSHRNKDNWNAIDPNLIDNYLVYGSFWDGIQILPLADDLKTATAAPRTLARRLEKPVALEDVTNPETFTMEGNESIEAGDNAIEAPFVIERDGWYYLFVSWDYCCRGKNSTYKTVYGRSRNIEGPYLDRNGKDMAYGGGTLLVGPNETFFGVGHCSAYEVKIPKVMRIENGKGAKPSQWFFVSHAYDISKDGRAKLFLRRLHFTADGWLTL